MALQAHDSNPALPIMNTQGSLHNAVQEACRRTSSSNTAQTMQMSLDFEDEPFADAVFDAEQDTAQISRSIVNARFVAVLIHDSVATLSLCMLLFDPLFMCIYTQKRNIHG